MAVQWMMSVRFYLLVMSHSYTLLLLKCPTGSLRGLNRGFLPASPEVSQKWPQTMNVMHKNTAICLVLSKQLSSPVIRGSPGNKFPARILTYDFEFNPLLMDAVGVVPLSAKPAHTITEPPPYFRLEK